jgi:hypothetical protein
VFRLEFINLKDRGLAIQNNIVLDLYAKHQLKKGLRANKVREVHGYVVRFIENLVEASLLGRAVAFRFSDDSLTRKVKHRVINALSEELLVSSVKKGYYFEEKYSPSLAIPGAIAPFSFDQKRQRNRKPSVILRSSQSAQQLSEIETLNILNKCLHDFQPRVSVPLKTFTRIYNGDCNKGGRIYSFYQLMPKEKRGEVLIDGEQVAELDYPNNHIKMLLHVLGIQTEIDLYEGFSEERALVKRAINVMMNSKNPRRVLGDMRFTAEFRWNQSRINRFMDEFSKRFPELKRFEGSNIGMVLQKIEGDVALDIMQKAHQNNKVVLPIHDSFMFKCSENDWVSEHMKQSWQAAIYKNQAILK